MNTTTQTTVELEKFLIRANAIIRVRGYISNTVAKETGVQSTSELAFAWADDNKPREIMNISFDYTDKVIAKEVAEWMAAIDRNTANDYMQKLSMLGAIKLVVPVSMGYAASAIFAFDKEKNKKESENKAAEKVAETFGAVGTKISVGAVFVNRSGFDSKFGWCNKYHFIDANGNNIVWMTSTDLEGITQGNAYTVTATVKKYSTYRGKTEVEITRAKIS